MDERARATAEEEGPEDDDDEDDDDDVDEARRGREKEGPDLPEEGQGEEDEEGQRRTAVTEDKSAMTRATLFSRKRGINRESEEARVRMSCCLKTLVEHNRKMNCEKQTSAKSPNTNKQSMKASNNSPAGERGCKRTVTRATERLSREIVEGETPTTTREVTSHRQRNQRANTMNIK